MDRSTSRVRKDVQPLTDNIELPAKPPLTIRENRPDLAPDAAETGADELAPNHGFESRPDLVPPPHKTSRALAGLTLSRRLFLFVVLTILATEAVIFLPSAANYRWNFISDRARLGQVAALALELAQDRTEELTGAQALVEEQKIGSIRLIRKGEASIALLPERHQTNGLVHVNLSRYDPFNNILGVIETLMAPKGRVILVQAPSMLRAQETVEVTLDEDQLKEGLVAFTWRIMGLSLVIAFTAGGAIYLIISQAFVAPMVKIIRSIHEFREHPEDASRKVATSGRRDEIGAAEMALSSMQDEVRTALRANERLAQLGAAVAKINHDLRNSLASAQILSERLVASEDPKVRQIAPRIERALERAINLTQATLNFGKAEENKPGMRVISAAAVIEGAAAEALAAYPEIIWRNKVDPMLRINADPEHLHRVVANLVRNAAQALSAQANRDIPGQIEAASAVADKDAILRVSDDGPGIPERVQKRLFEAFTGSGRNGGTGLGLAIARELTRAMGGELLLDKSDNAGTVFRIRLTQVKLERPAS